MAEKKTSKAGPVRIPLTFDAALGGLLGVNPKEPAQKVVPAAKNAAKKKRSNQSKG